MKNIKPTESIQASKNIQPRKIIQDFRAIIIGEIFRSDTFTEMHTFLALKVLIYLLKKDYPYERPRSSDYVFTKNMVRDSLVFM